VITVGIDLSSQEKKTAACKVNWQANEATVESLEIGVSDKRIRELAATADKVGIDIPFGWPEAFARAVTAHHAKQKWVATQDPKLMRLRSTDLFVHEKTGKWPLSVSTDRIAIPAFRAAALMSTLAEAGMPVDRTGVGKFVEVYPAAALRHWGIPGGAKDTPNLIPSLCQCANWLRMSAKMLKSACDCRDACDSLLASLIARAAAIGLCESIPENDRPAAEVEGWIAIPLPDSLPRLLAGG